MKLKLDENLPESLVATLNALKHDTDNVRLENLAGRPDADVFSSLRTWTFLTSADSRPGLITVCCCCGCSHQDGWLWPRGFRAFFETRT